MALGKLMLRHSILLGRHLNYLSQLDIADETLPSRMHVCVGDMNVEAGKKLESELPG